MINSVRSLFIGHGAPTLAVSTHPVTAFLRALGTQLAAPRAVVVISPHRMAGRFGIGVAPRFEAWHDFQGFPEALYKIQYAPPGDPDLARAIARKLEAAGISCELSGDARIDHGIWVPLRLLWPDCQIPVIPLAPLGTNPRAHYELGKALRRACDGDTLIMGSGSITHNFSDLDFGNEFAPPDTWAQEFDQWIAQSIESGASDNLLNYRTLAPHASRAHPSEEHLMPLFVAMGAGAQGQRIFRGFSHSNLSLSAFAFQ